jgi:hypothetical protein
LLSAWVLASGKKNPYTRPITHIKKGKETLMRFNRNIGFLLLAIWLILTGLAAFIPMLAGLGMILAVLAIAAGVLIALNR